jgi:shikimate dehydrogenase
MILATTKLCMIIGDPVEQSLSPLMHNAGYKAAGIESEFVYCAAKVSAEQLAGAIAGLRALSIRGVSCTIPHKVAVIPFLDEVDPIARRIGAVNTVVNSEGKLTGYNTDYLGIRRPLLAKTSLKNKRVAILGAGGAARAAAAAVAGGGNDITVFNRSSERAAGLARAFPVKTANLDQMKDLSNFDIIVNTTPVGMGEEKSIVPDGIFRKGQIVFDTVYKPHKTLLLRDALNNNAEVIYGIEMLLHQGMAQFELYTERPAPGKAMRAALYNHLGIES